MAKKRIEGMDFLRGFSIALMFYDHILGIGFLERIQPFNGRFWTRLSEPLFALLFGYFLVGRKKSRLFLRAVEIAGTALIVNFGFYLVTGRFEILVSFLATAFLYMLIGERIKFLVPVVFLYPIDPTRPFLDYPLSIVLGQTAIGMMIREGRTKQAVASSFLFLLGLFFTNPPWQYTVIFTFLASMIMMVFSSVKELKDLKLEPLNYIGKRPLFFYVLQYLGAIMFAIIYRSLVK